MKGYRKNVKTKTKKERKRMADFLGEIGKRKNRKGGREIAKYDRELDAERR